MKYVTIDPGMSGTGVAVWSRLRGSQSLYLEYWQNLYPYKNDTDWLAKCGTIAEKLVGMLDPREVYYHTAWVEMPAHFESFTGATAEKTGATLKLAWLVGYFTAILESHQIPVKLVDVNAWKGQLPKDVVKRRVYAHYKERFRELGKGPLSHSIDAIGIGMALNGYL